MGSTVTFTLRDFSDEYSGVTFPIADIDETSWVQTNTLIVALQAALNAASIGNIATRTLTAYRQNVDDNRPNSPFAQRELGLRLFYADVVNGKKYHLTIPCPDLTVMSQGGSDDIDLTLSAAAAVVSAMEMLMVTPDGNAVDIYRGTIVGRRS